MMGNQFPPLPTGFRKVARGLVGDKESREIKFSLGELVSYTAWLVGALSRDTGVSDSTIRTVLSTLGTLAAKLGDLDDKDTALLLQGLRTIREEMAEQSGERNGLAVTAHYLHLASEAWGIEAEKVADVSCVALTGWIIEFAVGRILGEKELTEETIESRVGPPIVGLLTLLDVLFGLTGHEEKVLRAISSTVAAARLLEERMLFNQGGEA